MKIQKMFKIFETFLLVSGQNYPGWKWRPLGASGLKTSVFLGSWLQPWTLAVWKKPTSPGQYFIYQNVLSDLTKYLKRQRTNYTAVFPKTNKLTFMWKINMVLFKGWHAGSVFWKIFLSKINNSLSDRSEKHYLINHNFLVFKLMHVMGNPSL